LVPKKKNLAKKHYYLKSLFKNQALPVEKRKREVYIDKNYIYKSYNCNNDSIWDPNNKQNVMTENAKYKDAAVALLQLSKNPTQGYLS
jgi:hypothetical protein